MWTSRSSWQVISGSTGSITRVLTRALRAAPPTSTAPRAKALVALGALEWRQGNYVPARQHLHEARTSSGP
jgi:hypothetical protein